MYRPIIYLVINNTLSSRAEHTKQTVKNAKKNTFYTFTFYLTTKDIHSSYALQYWLPNIVNTINDLEHNVMRSTLLCVMQVWFFGSLALCMTGAFLLFTISVGVYVHCLEKA